MNEPLLAVKDLSVTFPGSPEPLHAVRGLSYELHEGQALAIVGESGSGKSISTRALLGLLPSTARVTSGSALYRGNDLLKLPAARLRRIRGAEIAMVFQNSSEALNPTLTLETQLTEHLVWHGICKRGEAQKRAVRAFGDVGISEPEKRIRLFPFQLSGGMRQRAMIAMATVTRPRLLIADEPTTALDVTVQRQVLELFSELKNAGTTTIMITHDMGVARFFCDDVVVMLNGEAVERGDMETFIAGPQHPYSRRLLDANIELGEGRRRRATKTTPVDDGPPVEDASRPVIAPDQIDRLAQEVGTHG
ncbi:ABC transporter ATP-binding protein [Microbacterium sp. 179-I 3D2 NHS]|uniref:ABC transporter ATP-binding protein n=1 Tax=Microbacterium sp. 179-I 3D2 NHS TaxID=3235178 RepID=UPI00399F0CFF